MARALGLLLHPAVPGFFVALYAAIQHEGGLTARLLGVAALVSGACILLPLFVLYLGYQLGLTGEDLWARERQHRRYFYPAALLGLAASFSIFVWIYPFPLARAMVLAAIGVTAGLAVVNGWLKASIHVAGNAAVSLAAIYAYGAPVSALLLIVPVVGWARVASGAHTPREVYAGAAIGTLGTALGLLFIRP